MTEFENYLHLTLHTSAKNATGRWVLWVLVILLLLVHFANTVGPTPPDSVMIVFVSSMIMMTILISLAYWADRNRKLRSS